MKSPIYSLILSGVMAMGTLSTVGSSDGLVRLSQYNCTACHPAGVHQAPWISPKIAPRLNAPGERLHPSWIQHYLSNPQVAFPKSTMPDVIKGDSEIAETLTHYLMSLSPASSSPVFPDRAAVSRGEVLYHQIGCVACHAPQNADIPFLPKAPFPDVTEKWSFEGLRQFLRNPLASRPSGRMPSMNLSDSEAYDLAHYLLREVRVFSPLELIRYRGRIRSFEDLETAEWSRTSPTSHFTLGTLENERGFALTFKGFLRVDVPGRYTFHLTAIGSSRLSIREEWILGEDSWRREKVDASHTLQMTQGWHPIQVDFVQRGRNLPALKLEWEGPGLPIEEIPSSRLRFENADIPAPPTFVVDPAKANQGRIAFADLNCVSCHGSPDEAKKSFTLSELQNLDQGCLADHIEKNVPDFHLDDPTRKTLRDALAFLQQPELKSPNLGEQLSLTLNTLQCTACHKRDGRGGVTAELDPYYTSNGEDLGEEGRIPPDLDGVGDRLKPQWIEQVLTQAAKVRPYLNTRMPQYGEANVSHLPGLFVTLDRTQSNPAASLQVVPDSPEIQREAGRLLTGTDGLSCIGCHRFNRQPAHALNVIDLVTTTTRLNEDWFRSFLLDPNRYHPGTRMPAFWPDGVSLLPALLDGDTLRQHAALWTYLADGDRAKFPEGLSRQNMELIVGGEAVVYRGKMWEAGFRAVAVGYPGQINLAFDAEEMRLALLWQGRFLNAGAHWGVQGMGRIRPLSNQAVIFPHGTPFALLSNPSDPWPEDEAKALGMKFRGYQLDSQKQPTLLYQFASLEIEDYFSPVETLEHSGIKRTLRFSGKIPDQLHLRLAAGNLIHLEEKSWKYQDLIHIRILSDATPVQRGDQEEAELLLPLSDFFETNPLEIEYAW